MLKNIVIEDSLKEINVSYGYHKVSNGMKMNSIHFPVSFFLNVYHYFPFILESRKELCLSPKALKQKKTIFKYINLGT
jgi:hypothetical protein